MIVVDASAVIGFLAGQPDIPGLVDRVRGDGDLHAPHLLDLHAPHLLDLHAPHLLDVEFQHALRRLVVAGAISDDRAADARVDFADWPSSATRTSPWRTGCGSCGTT